MAEVFAFLKLYCNVKNQDVPIISNNSLMIQQSYKLPPIKLFLNVCMKALKLILVIIDSQFSTECSDVERPSPMLWGRLKKKFNIRFKINRVAFIQKNYLH